MYMASFKTPENWVKECGIDFKNKEAVFAWFKKEFASWSDKWQEIFTGDDVYCWPRPLYYFPLDQSWKTNETLTMIGDAAHRMPPYAGEGANVSMQDSFELSEALTNGKFTDIKTAIAHFEKDMVARSAESVKMTLENTERMFSENGMEKMVEFFNQQKDEE